ncbi:MAG: biotin--[acetyl-CoA-carboxylase] ligase [Chloroflexota bacterium]
MTTTLASDTFSRVEHFASVASTNDVVRSWLAAGTPEVCVAVADEQTAGRGRNGRTWVAPPGSSLLTSLGFRPTWLPPADSWRLAALVAMAMADAAEDHAGMTEGTIRLKWPNDLVIVSGGPDALLVGDITADEARELQASPIAIRKLAGILGETDGLGTDDPRLVIGIGLNADWDDAELPAGVPADLATSMTTLRAASGGRPIDREPLLEAFLSRMETRLAALRAGRFDVAGWTDRQVTTGHLVSLAALNGEVEHLRALGVDGASGALVVADPDEPRSSGGRLVHAGEILRLRVLDAGGV